MAVPWKPSGIQTSTLAWAIFVMACALHFGFHSPWLDDYDSVQFALGMEHLDIAVHQPHPPGYAGYIYMARAVDSVLGDRQASLSLLSTFGGAASVALTFVLGATLVSTGAGLLAAAILLLIPLHFQQSLVAMTDVVVIPFFLGTLLCLRESARRSDARGTIALAAAGLLMGWGVGVRPQWIFLFAAAGLAYVLWQRDARRAAVLAASGLLATLGWLVPVSVGQGGFRAYLALARRQYAAHPSDRAHFAIGEILQFSRWIVHRWEVPVAILAIMAALAALSFTRWMRGSGAVREAVRPPPRTLVVVLAGWFLLAAATSLLFHPLRLPRSAVPLLPPLALLLAAIIATGIACLRSPWLRLAAFLPAGVALGLMAATCIRQGVGLRTIVPPPIQGARFIQREFDPATTLLVGRRNHRHWGYYAPEFRIRIQGDPTPFRIAGAFGPYEHVVTDYPIFNVTPTRTVQFSRSPEVYFDFPTVTLYQYDNERVMLAGREGAFGMGRDGFWMGPDLRGTVRSPGATERQIAIRLRSSFGEPRRAVVRLEGRDAWTGTIGKLHQTVVVPLPADLEWTPFELASPDGCRHEISPAGRPGRCLSFLVRDLRVMPARYRLDTEVHFQWDRGGHVFLRDGWSQPEAWGVWALGSGAALEFRLERRPERDLRLYLDGYWYIQPGQPPLRMALLVNGVRVEARTIPLTERDNPSFTIPAAVIGDDARLRVEFRFANPASPTAIGQSDSRTLGLALRSLRLYEPR